MYNIYAINVFGEDINEKVNSVRRIVFTILAVTWMVVIFSFSARPGMNRKNRVLKQE